VPWSDIEQRRIDLTTACRASDRIPKVPGAGEVHDGVQTMHNGVRVADGCYYGGWMTEVIRRLRGHHEPQEEVAVHAVLERLAAESPVAPVAIELGSFWAYYSLWFLQRFPDGVACLVEPDPAYLLTGQRNFELNGRTGRFHRAAVGGEVGRTAFACESDGETREVPVETLPSLFDHFGVDRVDVLFCDVQGAEHAFLSSGEDLLREGKVRFAVVSTHHHVISHDPLLHHRTVALLRSLDAHVITEHTIGESFSGDGLVVVSFDDRDRDLEVVVPHARVGDSLFGDPLADLAAVQDECRHWRSEAERLARELSLIAASRTWRYRERVARIVRRR
jgi:FkbM family methyltransferase